MSTLVYGTAHPPAHECYGHPADLNNAEIESAELGSNGEGGMPCPLLVEHTGAPVGEVEHSWRGARGELRVAARIKQPGAIEAVRNGTMRGLSLGTNVQDIGNGSNRAVDELSICKTPARRNCYIDMIDGRKVLSRHNASGADSYSADYVAQLKEQLKAAQESRAVSDARVHALEQRERDEVKQWIPEMKTGIGMISEARKDDAIATREFGTMQNYLEGLSSRTGAVEEFRPMARTMYAFSADLKRARDDIASQKETVEKAKSMHEEMDKLRNENEDLNKRLKETTMLAAERADQIRTMNTMMAREGLIQQKYDFSLQSSREAMPPPPVARKEADPDPFGDFTAEMRSLGQGASTLAHIPARMNDKLPIRDGDGSSAGASQHGAGVGI